MYMLVRDVPHEGEVSVIHITDVSKSFELHPSLPGPNGIGMQPWSSGSMAHLKIQQTASVEPTI
jgi:hypothetical protein